MNQKLKGLIAAPFTPMTPEGGVELETIEEQAKALARNGVIGAFICGTTGEGLSLTTAERIQVAEKWVAVAPKQLRVIVHVGHNAIGESKELAAHAQKINAHAIAMIGPNFFRPPTPEKLAMVCASVAEAAPELPFYYYHIPVMTGVDLPMIEFLGAASKHIPNFAGIKFTHENLMDFSRCVDFDGGRYDILFGRDEILLAALSLGATGAVGSTYNFMAQVYHRVLEAFEKGDLETARRHQQEAIRIIAVMSKYGGLPAGKAMMKMAGIDCGPVRPPLCDLGAEKLDLFRQELEDAGFP